MVILNINSVLYIFFYSTIFRTYNTEVFKSERRSRGCRMGKENFSFFFIIISLSFLCMKGSGEVGRVGRKNNLHTYKWYNYLFCHLTFRGRR